MRVLAMDIGKRRIGVAVSDELGLLARPVQAVRSVSLNVDVQRIAELAHELGAEMVVVGDPLHMSGDPSTMSGRARKFGETLQAASGLPVEYFDERLTSVEAERILRESGVPHKKVREQIDAMAASVILQSYLNSKKPPRSPDAPPEDRYW